MTMTTAPRKRSRVWLSLGIAFGVAVVCFAPRTRGAQADCAAAKTTYATSCSMCHRADGKGYAAIKTVDLTDQRWQATHKDSELISAISNGVKATAMPAFKDQLTSQQIEDLVHCVVRGFGKKPAAKPAVSKRSSNH